MDFLVCLIDDDNDELGMGFVFDMISGKEKK